MSTVPATIEQYFASAPTNDVDGLMAVFADDAVVVDEGHTYRGAAEIRAWRDTIASAFEYTVEVVSVSEAGGPEQYSVVGHLVGTFPGSPVDLTFAFGLRDGKIATLTVAP